MFKCAFNNVAWEDENLLQIELNNGIDCLFAHFLVANDSEHSNSSHPIGAEQNRAQQDRARQSAQCSHIIYALPYWTLLQCDGDGTLVNQMSWIIGNVFWYKNRSQPLGNCVCDLCCEYYHEPLPAVRMGVSLEIYDVRVYNA